MDVEIARRLKPWFPNTDIARVRVVTGGPMCWFVRVLNQGGMTIAPFVFFGKTRFDPASASSMALLAHELKHIEQYAAMGHAKFLFTYIRDRLRAGEYRRDLPLEVDPYALQQKAPNLVSTVSSGGHDGSSQYSGRPAGGVRDDG